MSSLIQNINKIHTTKLGVERIERNLNLTADDVVSWCKNAISNADSIVRQGKNWYAYGGGNVITVNAKSFTIITAHKVKAKIRIMEESDYECLPEFLYQAIFIPEGVEPPPGDIIFEKDIFIYINDFGKQSGDLGVVAEVNGQIIGAAWTRIIPAFGHLDNETPELAISLLPEFRSLGIGTKLMQRLFDLLKENGYKQTSLSVQKDNPALRFYNRIGYKIMNKRSDRANHGDCLMIKDLSK